MIYPKKVLSFHDAMFKLPTTAMTGEGGEKNEANEM